MARGAVIDDQSQPGEVRELGMSVDVDEADAGAWRQAVTGADRPDVGWWRTRWPVVLVAVAATIVVVLVGRPDARPVASIERWPELQLADVPATAPIQRWTLDLGTRDEVALVDDRVVVADVEGAGFTGPTHLSARNVRSKNLLWERELPDAVSLLMVDPAGRTTRTRQSPFGPGDDPSRRLVAVASDDGRVLWDRPPADRWVAANRAADTVLLVADDGCELVEVVTGDVVWDTPDSWCEWVDPATFVAQPGPDWELRGVDGELLLRTPAGGDTGPPLVVDDLVVTLDDRDVTAMDRTGAVQWRTTTTFDPDFLTDVPDGGIVAVRVDEEGNPQEQQGWDLEGVSLGDVEVQPFGLPVEVDASTYRVNQDFVSEANVVTTVDRIGEGEPSDTTSVTSRQLETGAFGGLTRHGLLAVSVDEPPMLEFRAWPSLDVTWSVPVPGTLARQEFTPTTVLTSVHGLVIIPADTSEVVLHAYG